MLGLGAIVEGYSLIATRKHIRSMLDLSCSEAKDLLHFTAAVRPRLESAFGPVTIAEHGRVPPCESAADPDGRDPHCFHAHRLVFPLDLDLRDQLKSVALSLSEYSDFMAAWTSFTWPDEYLYFERPDGSCALGAAPRPIARQFFRRMVASAIQRPELASWRAFPELPAIDSARRRLGLAAP